jgi:hypothetical protein
MFVEKLFSQLTWCQCKSVVHFVHCYISFCSNRVHAYIWFNAYKNLVDTKESFKFISTINCAETLVSLTKIYLHLPIVCVIDTADKKRAVERRLTLGAFIVCFVEWVYTPYSFYISMIDTSFVLADYQRHAFIYIAHNILFTVVTPYTLFCTSPTVRTLFLNDWLRI